MHVMWGALKGGLFPHVSDSDRSRLYHQEDEQRKYKGEVINKSFN